MLRPGREGSIQACRQPVPGSRAHRSALEMGLARLGWLGEGNRQDGAGKNLELFQIFLVSVVPPMTDGVSCLGHLPIPASLNKNKNKIPIPLNLSV